MVLTNLMGLVHKMLSELKNGMDISSIFLSPMDLCWFFNFKILL
jgi:hypothetical protein